MAMSFWSVALIQMGWTRRREIVRICAFGSPWSRTLVEPALMLYAAGPTNGYTQWAAVNPLVVESTDPPHKCVARILRLIWYGYSWIVVSFPPTILSSLDDLRICGAAKGDSKWYLCFGLCNCILNHKLKSSKCYLRHQQILQPNTERSLSFSAVTWLPILIKTSYLIQDKVLSRNW